MRACEVCQGTGAVRTPAAPHGSGIDACPRCARAAELAWLDRGYVAEVLVPLHAAGVPFGRPARPVVCGFVAAKAA